MSSVYCALIHHPVRDRQGQTVTTAVTTLDVHDIARSAHTYGLRGYYVVTPIEAQHRLVERILEHWRSGAGSRRMPERGEALAICQPVAQLKIAIDRITAAEGRPPRILATAARPSERRALLSFADARQQIAEEAGPFVILFGTGHGLADELLAEADELLAPIRGGGPYNHLSVRSAAAIVLDRLLSGVED